MSQRTIGRPFKRGESGNPGGRPRAVRAVEEAAKAHTETALATLAEICGDQKAPPAARVAAAEALLNRGWGRPTQRLAGDEIAGPLKISWIS